MSVDSSHPSESPAGNLMEVAVSSVGLITCRDHQKVNVMAAEWTYLVAQSPVYFAVGCQLSNYSTSVILASGEFGVTLCDENQAPLAKFVGTFSGAGVDKSAVSGMALRPAQALSTPTVLGGLMSAECVVREVVDLPGYVLVVGEARWSTINATSLLRPLVKHGKMYALGTALEEPRITASLTRLPTSEWTDGPRFRLCATAFGAEDNRSAMWSVSLRSRGARTSGTIVECVGGGVLDIELSPGPHAVAGSEICVSRSGLATIRLPV